MSPPAGSLELNASSRLLLGDIRDGRLAVGSVRMSACCRGDVSRVVVMCLL